MSTDAAHVLYIHKILTNITLAVIFLLPQWISGITVYLSDSTILVLPATTAELPVLLLLLHLCRTNTTWINLLLNKSKFRHKEA